MRTSDFIDLSKLPPPHFVDEKDPGIIAREMMAAISASIPGLSFLPSDPLTKLIELFAYREAMLLKRINDAGAQCMLAFATGDNLVQLGALFGVERNTKDNQGLTVSLSDGDLREKILRSLDATSTAGSYSGYRYHAMDAGASDLVDCNPYQTAPGRISIVLLFARYLYPQLGMSDSERTTIEKKRQLAFDKIEARLTSDDVRPLTDAVTVTQARFMDFTIDAVLDVPRGADDEVLAAAARSRLTLYLRENELIGRSIRRSAIFAALHVDTRNVHKVDLVVRIGDQQVDEVIINSFDMVPRCVNVDNFKKTITTQVR